MARPRIEIDREQFEKLCALQCTLEEIAAWFKCSPDTIENWCKREFKECFSDTYKKYSASGKISLRRYQFKMAEHNCTMAIWLGKQWLNQKDYVEVDAPNTESAIERIAKQIMDGSARGKKQ
jgi:hypothetical protein